MRGLGQTGYVLASAGYAHYSKGNGDDAGTPTRTHSQEQ